jgi:hypothetical protein
LLTRNVPQTEFFIERATKEKLILLKKEEKVHKERTGKRNKNEREERNQRMEGDCGDEVRMLEDRQTFRSRNMPVK